MTEHEARTVSIWIGREPQAVYAYAAEPTNLPVWAAGLCKAITRRGEDWIAETPAGPMQVRFTERNRFGVLDHHVQPATGAEVYVPMRVVAHGTGAEVLLTLLRQPGMTDEKFAEDARFMERDLQALKAALQG